MHFRSCYGPVERPTRMDDAAEFDLQSVRAWLEQTRRFGVARAVPRFFVKLDRLSRVCLGVYERLDVLRELKRPLLKLAAGMPKPVPGRGGRKGGGDGLLLEQQLYCLTVRNLRLALADLDEFAADHNAESDKIRRWLARNLFRFLGRQIQFGLLYRQAIPSLTWRGLHDLHAYASVRRLAMPKGAPRRQGKGVELNPGLEYRRLLLIGLAGSLAGEQRMTPETLGDISDLAPGSRLSDPSDHIGETDLFLVDTHADGPPRHSVAAPGVSFRGWVLLPGDGFLGYLHGEGTGGKGFQPLFA